MTMTEQEFLEQVKYAKETKDWDYLAELIMPDPEYEDIPWDDFEIPPDPKKSPC